MGLITNHEFQGNIYDSAYLKIAKISISNIDVEKLVDNEDNEGQHVIFEKQTEAIAMVLVFADEESRILNVRPIHSFGFKFPYPNFSKNIFQEAYENLFSDLSKTGEVKNT